MSDSNVQKFQFSTEEDGSLSLESAVYQALGFASVCWEPMDGTGIFQEDLVKQAGEALLEKIHSYDYPRPSGDFIDIGPQCFTNGEVISYKGQNYYKACDAWVPNKDNGSQTFCTKRVGHPGYLHEDYDGNVSTGTSEGVNG